MSWNPSIWRPLLHFIGPSGRNKPPLYFPCRMIYFEPFIGLLLSYFDNYLGLFFNCLVDVHSMSAVTAGVSWYFICSFYKYVRLGSVSHVVDKAFNIFDATFKPWLDTLRWPSWLPRWYLYLFLCTRISWWVGGRFFIFNFHQWLLILHLGD